MSKLPCQPVILIILDGWGETQRTRFNAIYSARKPYWDKIWADYPHTLISASGTDVGLPDQQMGNSEVGHMNIGSGRIIDQDFTRITRSIEDGSFYEIEVLTTAMKNVAASNKALHILGLLSDGGVHSHQDHICAIIEQANRARVDKIYLHAFLDGRDTAPNSARAYLEFVQAKFTEIGKGQIVSIVGRFYAMDRNQNWERTQAAYELIMRGEGKHRFAEPIQALTAAYERGESDEFVLPTAINAEQNEPIEFEEGDAFIFANYRSDRARQLSMALTKTDFNAFSREILVESTNFISLTKYKADFEFPAAFPPVQHKNVFGEHLANLGLRQLRIAETEKYAHVTFFFNGGEERVFDNEDRILVPSPYVSTYDQQPEMNADEVAEKMIEAIQSRKYDAIISNFANADMVGHTGNFEAAVQAIETLDACLQKVIDAALGAGAELLITADHGNAEQMREISKTGEEGQAHTAHTNNLVPLIYIGRTAEIVNQRAALCDLAPTMLHLMGLEQPDEMTGKTIFQLDDISH
jgi:2,3-bisphosphoglycerate-independent phosphoglycerate mutase